MLHLKRIFIYFILFAKCSTFNGTPLGYIWPLSTQVNWYLFSTARDSSCSAHSRGLNERWSVHDTSSGGWSLSAFLHHQDTPPLGPLRAQLSLFFLLLDLKKIWTFLAALALSMCPFVEGCPEESSAMTWHEKERRRIEAVAERCQETRLVLLLLQRSASSFHEICHVCRGARSFCCCCSCCSKLLWPREPIARSSPPLTASSHSLQQNKVSLFLSQFAVSTV